jgi:hemerythrin superfamily protein
MARAQTGGESRDAIDLLMDDHKRVQKIFDDFETVDRDDAEAVQELVETACMELQLHSMLEEEIFYPAVRAQIDAEEQDASDLLNEAEVEHETVDDLVAKLQELEPEDAMYAAYFNVLAKLVKQHVHEEENDLFPDVRNMDLDLQQLGDDMHARREELFAEMEADDGTDAEDADVVDEADDDTLSEVDEETEDAQEQIDISRTRH